MKYYSLIIRTGDQGMANDEVCSLAHNAGVIYLQLGTQRDERLLYQIVQTGSLYAFQVFTCCLLPSGSHEGYHFVQHL